MSGLVEIKSTADWLRYTRGNLGAPGAEPFVFVSWSLPDHEIVERAMPILEDSLRHVTCPMTGQHYRVVHYSHPDTGTPFGSLFPQEIAKWMWTCRAAVLVWSQDFIKSSWCYPIEAPCLLWRRENQKLPVYVLRVGPTVDESNTISVDDGSGARVTVDLNYLADDRNPKNNRGVDKRRRDAWLSTLKTTNFRARLISLGKEIATQVEERWNIAPAGSLIVPSPSLAAPVSLPRVEWAGDFSADGGAIVGRDDDLRRLTEDARDPAVAMMAITALAGQGKTALVRTWIDDVCSGRSRAFEGIFAFGFYHGHSQEEFAQKLLTFLDPAAPPPAPGASAPVRLVEKLRGRRVLLFLDGLEVIQNEVQERESEEGPVARGPLAQGPVLDLLFGLCVEEANKSLAVITSRLRLVGFEEYDGTRFVRAELGGLRPEEGGKLLRDLGVTNATQAQRRRYSGDLAGHPLLLHVFADAVRRRALTLDFGNAAEKVAEAMGIAAPVAFKDKLRRVVDAYRDQFTEQERAIIEAVAVFGGTATIQRIRAYLRQRNGMPSAAGEVTIAGQIDALVTAGILQFRDDGGTHRYSCHPILREAFRPGAAGSRSAVAISLFSRPAPLRPRTLSEADSYLEAIRIHTDSGAFDEANNILARHLMSNYVLVDLVGGQRALLECLLGFLNPRRRDACAAALGQEWIRAVVPQVVIAAIALDEWEIADEYARWDAELTSQDREPLNSSLQAEIAAEIGTADGARTLYGSAIAVEAPELRGKYLLDQAALEHQLGAPRIALELVRQWIAMHHPVRVWITGWDSLLDTVSYVFRRSHQDFAVRCVTGRAAIRKMFSPDDQNEDYFAEYALLNLKRRAGRTRDDWLRLLELAELLEQAAEASGSKTLRSWPIVRAAALNGLGRSPEAEDVMWRSIHQLHERSWRRLWFKIEIARARLLQGQIPAGLRDAWQILEDARRQQRYILARDVAKLIVEFGPQNAERTQAAQRVLDEFTERSDLADDEIPDLGPLPGEPGWDGRVTQLLLREVQLEHREAPVAQEEIDAALVLAAELGLPGAILELLRLGASPRAISKKGTSALAEAASRGHQRIVEVLLQVRSEPLDLADEHDLSAATEAIAANQDLILERLLSAWGAKNTNLLAALLVQAAARVASGETIRVLCDAGADPNQRHDGRHPLVRAAEAGNLSAVEVLTGRISDVNKATDSDGETALMAAMGAGHEPIIIWLVNHGAKVDTRDNAGRTASEYAIRGGQIRALDVLAAETGRDVVADVELSTLAVAASLNGQVEELRRAVERGARVDEPDRQGYTPLRAAAARGHLDVIRAIRELTPHSDINAQDGNGFTALMTAAAAGHEAVVVALVNEFGARLDATDDEDRDAITHALAQNQPDIIRLLASLGARPRKTEATIEAIRTAAADNNRDALVAFLRAVAEAGWMEHLSERVAL